MISNPSAGSYELLDIRVVESGLIFSIGNAKLSTLTDQPVHSFDFSMNIHQLAQLEQLIAGAVQTMRMVQANMQNSPITPQ